ncbi:MAG: hypothetical protein HY741_19400 [Chloroflexi bacterium]|nr:hypothetical protein [Chloroflexota bacterium]
MNRRLVFPIAMLSLGLMVGVLVGRWFMPDRYGLLTMVLLVLGGMVTGALVMHAASVARSNAPLAPALATSNVTAPPQPLTWQLQLGGNRFVVRYDAGWWGRTRASLVRAPVKLADPPSSRFAIGCLWAGNA